ncbi:MAG: hypothetical protein Q7R76_04300 [Candidatus Woesearchaeota archaeon]|nr:hypothetical protein [Candidatus Woesearchaeota archaeon]
MRTMRTLNWRIIVSVFVFLAFLTGCSVDLVGNSGTTSNVVSVPPAPIPSSPELIEEQGTGVIETIVTCTLPQKIINNECCLDVDNTGVCDKYELQAACGDVVCSPNENECTCPLDCGSCTAKDLGVCKAGACENNVCVAKLNSQCCGDTLCKDGETCNTCFQDCCSITSFSSQEKLNLINFPGLAKGFSVVVGDKAPPEDVVVGEHILITIASEGLSVGKGMLASEIQLGAKDYIVIGNPCDNKAAAELFKIQQFFNTNPRQCQIFKPGEGLIKLFMTSEKTMVLYVGGYSPAETKRAAQRLLDYQKNILVGIEQKI